MFPCVPDKNQSPTMAPSSTPSHAPSISHQPSLRPSEIPTVSPSGVPSTGEYQDNFVQSSTIPIGTLTYLSHITQNPLFRHIRVHILRKCISCRTELVRYFRASIVLLIIVYLFLDLQVLHLLCLLNLRPTQHLRQLYQPHHPVSPPACLHSHLYQV